MPEGKKGSNGKGTEPARSSPRRKTQAKRMETDGDNPGSDTVVNSPINTVLTDDEELVFPPNQSSQPKFSEEQEEE